MFRLFKVASKFTYPGVRCFGKQIKMGAEARAKMLEGCNGLADAVQITLGPRGRNAALEKPYTTPKITKDGATVSKDVAFWDKFKNLGSSLLKEVAAKTNDEAGDGTTTATLLTRFIYKEGCKAVASGMNPLDVRKGVMMAVEAIVDQLQKMTTPVKGKEDYHNVATISANGDEKIGQIIASVYEKTGKDATVTVSEGKTLTTELEFVEGVKFNRGYISPHFITDPTTGKAELENPYILLVNQRISNIPSILKLLEHCVQQNRPLLLVCEDIDSEPLTTLIVNKLRGGLRICAVKAPSFGDNRKAVLEDIAISCGAQLIMEEAGILLDKAEPSVLGSAKQAIITKDDTIIMHGAGDKQKVADRVNDIKAEREKATASFDKEKLDERIGRLTGGVAVIKAGGASEIEVTELKERLNDALSAARAAAEEGILPGGGVSLLYASQALKDLKPKNVDQQHGIEIIKAACKVPCRTISNNAGYEGAVVVDKLLTDMKAGVGFDARTGKYVDMMKAGIVDPLKVVRTALVNASGLSSLMITTEAAIVDELKEAKKIAEHGGRLH